MVAVLRRGTRQHTRVKPLWGGAPRSGRRRGLSGHEHNYERFAPQDPNGRAVPKRGIREFVVGTGGGESHYPILNPIANSKVRDDPTPTKVSFFPTRRSTASPSFRTPRRHEGKGGMDHGQSRGRETRHQDRRGQDHQR
jgi:hypothetical protein